MIFKSIAIQGFRVFQKDVVLRFPPQAGLYQMVGDNREQPRHGASAVGKSTVWDALCWCLTGKTARGLRGPSVASWGAVELTSVLVEFEQANRFYAVTRTYNPNSLRMQVGQAEARVITEERLQQITGINHASFLHTVLMGQFNAYFFDLSPAQKLAVFNDALGLGYWLERAKKAVVKRQEVENLAAEATLRLAKGQGELKALKAQRVELRRLAQEFRAGQAARLTLLRDKGTELGSTRLHTSKQVDKAKQNYRCTKARIGEFEMELSKAHQWCQEAKRRADEALLKGNHLTDQANDYRDQAKLASKLDGNCTTCGQPVSRKHSDQLASQLRHKAHQLALEAIRAMGLAKDRSKGSDKACVAVNDISENLTAAKNGQAKAWRDLTDAKSKHKQADGDYKRHQIEWRAAKATTNPIAEQLQQVLGSITSLKEELASNRQQLSEYQVLSESYGFWAKTFKELRLWLMDEALTELALEVNNSLIELGLLGWSVSFEVERENQSGTVTSGFNVSIRSPVSPKRVPWEAWCGGETQRLRIAGAIGVANLILGRRGMECNLEVWDEPTAHLPEEGVADLLAFFESRSQRSHKQIWVVDHRSLASGSFDGRAKVIREAEGSRIVFHGWEE